jgi:TolA-binding protein
VRDAESSSNWVFGLSLVQVMLFLVFAVMLVHVTEDVEGSGQEVRQGLGEANARDARVQVRLEAATKKNTELEKQLNDTTGLVDELKLMVGAKASSKEGFREAIESLKRGYALCQKDENTLIEATIQHGTENVQVIGGVPSDLFVNLAKGDATSDLDQIVSFLQDVYEYEKDHKCRFNYRLKYATDNDYRKAREVYEKYFYPEKIMRTG